MSLNSIVALVARLRKGITIRQRFVESHLAKGIASQIRATRDMLGWSQEELAKKVGMNQNAISRLESSEYGKPTITTLKRLAAAFDVGLIVRFVPFSEMVYWVSGTTHPVEGLSTESLAVPSFNMEEERKVFDSLLAPPPQKEVEQRGKAALAAAICPSRSTHAIGELIEGGAIYGSDFLTNLYRVGSSKSFSLSEGRISLAELVSEYLKKEASYPANSMLSKAPKEQVGAESECYKHLLRFEKRPAGKVPWKIDDPRPSGGMQDQLVANG